MKKTLLMERVMDQVRLAVIEDGALCELYIKRPDAENLSGNIYVGRVQNVQPGINAAFVDIGMEKNGFLSAADIRLFARGDRALSQMLGKARIENIARPGQLMLVQAVRSQPGAKGPRLSCHVTLPGRLMVLMGGVVYVGVSRKIDDPAERERLKAAGQALVHGSGDGVILRTAARGAEDEALREEYERLSRLYAEMRRRAECSAAPKLLYDDNDLALRVVRDMLDGDVEAVWTDDDSCYESLLAHARTLAPALSDRIHRHEGQTPLFDLYRVDTQSEKALDRFVWLKSGASLVIDEAEALTAVDVNTGRRGGRRDADEAILQTNLEAARELMRQLRLRDLGGIIIADFIDMRGEDDRQQLMTLLRELACRDSNRTTVVDITPLGLVELTRRRSRQSLHSQLTRACAVCGGSGCVPSHEATARKALRDVWRRRRGGNATALAIEAEGAVCGWIKRIGLPEGGKVDIRPTEELGAGEYRITPLI